MAKYKYDERSLFRDIRKLHEFGKTYSQIKEHYPALNEWHISMILNDPTFKLSADMRKKLGIVAVDRKPRVTISLDDTNSQVKSLVHKLSAKKLYELGMAILDLFENVYLLYEANPGEYKIGKVYAVEPEGVAYIRDDHEVQWVEWSEIETSAIVDKDGNPL